MMADDLAAERMSRLTSAGLDRLTFAWAGPTAVGAKHYYRVQGPTFLIEYDNTQSDGNHIHAVWRDFHGDFGRDLLREHLREDHVHDRRPLLRARAAERFDLKGPSMTARFRSP